MRCWRIIFCECAPYQFSGTGDQKRVLTPQCIKFPLNTLKRRSPQALCASLQCNCVPRNLTTSSPCAQLFGVQESHPLFIWLKIHVNLKASKYVKGRNQSRKKVRSSVSMNSIIAHAQFGSTNLHMMNCTMCATWRSHTRSSSSCVRYFKF